MVDKRAREYDLLIMVSRISHLFLLAPLWGCAAAADASVQEIEFPPTFGFAGIDNHYVQRKMMVAEFDLEADPAGVTLIGNAAFTTAPGQVIGGARSVVLFGARSALEIDHAALDLRAGNIYALEYDYRILDEGGALSAMSVVGRWGRDAGLHCDPWGLRPCVFGPEGTQRRQFLFGDQGFPTFLLTPGMNSSVVVDNLRIWRLDSVAKRSEAEPFPFGFPRLSNYFIDSPHACAVYNDMRAAEIEEVLGRFDLINGVQIDATYGDTSWVERIRERNPDIVLLPYRLSYSAQELDRSEPVGGTCDLRALFNRAIPGQWIMRNPGGSPLMDRIFLGNTQLDPTSYCPPVGGMVFAQFMEKFIAESVLPSGLWAGVHFDQSEWYPNPLLAEYINGPLPPIDMNRDGMADSKPMMWGEMRGGFDRYFYLMRRRFGSSRILYGNPGRIPLDATVVAALNGFQQELLAPFEVLPNGDIDTSRAAQWHEFLRNYLSACYFARAPQAITVQCTGRGLGVETGGKTGHGYPNRVPEPEVRDFQRMRLGLTTTLLGNGFFGYDFVDNTTPPAWFDEYAVDASGHPTTDLSGKGYLGQPLAVAQEILRPGRVRLNTGFELEVPPGLVLGSGASFTRTSWQVIEGDASVAVPSPSQAEFLVFATDTGVVPLKRGTTYDLQVTFRVLAYEPEHYSGFFAVGIGADPYAVDFHGRAYAYHQDIQGIGQTITMRSQVKVTEPGSRAYGVFGDRGVVAIDSLRLSELNGGAFRRDFEGGIALVNPTPQPVTLTQREIAGPLGRTGIRRIAGVQDPLTNSGAPVFDGITIPAADGIILLADGIDAPPPLPPASVFVSPHATEPMLDLAWDAPQSATIAGYLVEFRIASSPDWDRYEMARPIDQHRLEFLLPGTTYEVRLAAFDFEGNCSEFSPIATATTAGTAPATPTISWVGPTVRGEVARVAGFEFSSSTADVSREFPYIHEGTLVTVNGEPAPLVYVSPTAIAFAVPERVALGEALVRVVRDGVASAGRIVQVEAPAPSCVGDLNGDGATNASDFVVMVGAFGSAVPPGASGDLNGDGVVDAADVAMLVDDLGCGG